MRVSITNLGKSFQLVRISEDGQYIEGWVALVKEGERIGSASYEQIKAFGEGETELAVPESQFYSVKNEQSEEQRWWEILFLSLVMFAMAGLSYWWLGTIEEGGGRIRIHWLIALIWGTLGREGVAVLFILFGVCLGYFGIRRIGTLNWTPVNGFQLENANPHETYMLRGIFLNHVNQDDCLVPVLGDEQLPIAHQIRVADLHLCPVQIQGNIDSARTKFNATSITPLGDTKPVWKAN